MSVSHASSQAKRRANLADAQRLETPRSLRISKTAPLLQYSLHADQCLLSRGRWIPGMPVAAHRSKDGTRRPIAAVNLSWTRRVAACLGLWRTTQVSRLLCNPYQNSPDKTLVNTPTLRFDSQLSKANPFQCPGSVQAQVSVKQSAPKREGEPVVRT